MVFSRRFSSEKSPTLTVASFIVGAFSFKEKSPTITVASFFFFFFRQTTDLIAYVPLFTDFTLAHMYSSVLGLRCYGEPSSHGFESLL